MDGNRPTNLGVTPPISTRESNEREKEVTVTLMEELRQQTTMESEEKSRTRCVHTIASTLSDLSSPDIPSYSVLHFVPHSVLHSTQ